MTVSAQLPLRGRAKLALVGAHPDVKDEGAPFTGPAGKFVLNPALAAANIAREDIYLGNLFEEVPSSQDELKEWMRYDSTMGPATARLVRELRAVSPNVIVPLGGPALLPFTGRDDIQRFRGNPIKSVLAMAGSKLYATVAPAFVLKQWQWLSVLIQDLIHARQEADKGPELVYPWREYTIEPTLEEVRRWMFGDDGSGLVRDSRGETFPALMHAPLLSADIETGWGQITDVSFASDPLHGLSIPFLDLGRPSRSYWDTAQEEIQVWTWIKQLLESDVPKLGQNYGSYDAYWFLDAMGIRTINFLHDTRLQHKIRFPQLPASLQFIAAGFTELQWKHWGLHTEEKRDA